MAGGRAPGLEIETGNSLANKLPVGGDADAGRRKPAQREFGSRSIPRLRLAVAGKPMWARLYSWRRAAPLSARRLRPRRRLATSASRSGRSTACRDVSQSWRTTSTRRRQRRILSCRPAASLVRMRGYLAAHQRGSGMVIAWAWDVYDAELQRAFRHSGEAHQPRPAGTGPRRPTKLCCARSPALGCSSLRVSWRRRPRRRLPPAAPAQRIGPRHPAMTCDPQPPGLSAGPRPRAARCHCRPSAVLAGAAGTTRLAMRLSTLAPASFDPQKLHRRPGYATMARRASPPLWGGVGWGVARCGASVPQLARPHPDPPHKGERIRGTVVLQLDAHKNRDNKSVVLPGSLSLLSDRAHPPVTGSRSLAPAAARGCRSQEAAMAAKNGAIKSPATQSCAGATVATYLGISLTKAVVRFADMGSSSGSRRTCAARTSS